MSKPTVKVEDAGIKGEDELDALFDEGELERILNSEASQVQREAEVSSTCNSLESARVPCSRV